MSANDPTIIPETSKTQDNNEQLLRKTFDIIIEEGYKKGFSRDNKVVDFRNVEELESIMELDIGEEGCTDNKVLELCRKALQFSTRTRHPYFMNQLYGEHLPVGLAAACVLEAINTNVHTYEAAPVLCVVEKQMIKEMGRLVAYGDNIDGIFMPGGSLTNMMGFHVARYSRLPEIKRKGVFGFRNLVMFTSEMGHYSVDRGANFLGMGTDNCVAVKTDDKGRMCPVDLEDKVKQHLDKGHCPFLVNATSGTTVLGAFDPLDAIADVCENHNMWMHVDACFGSGALFAEKTRPSLRGLERSNSVTLSFHKTLHVPIQCNLLLVRHETALSESLSDAIPYLFQPDKFYDMSYDIGTKTVMCGRKGDAFKIWLAWKSVGHSGFRDMMNRSVSLSDLFLQKLKQRNADFRTVLPEYEYLAISFWYIPPSMRGQNEDEEWWERLSQVAPKIKERMVKSGSMMIGYQPLAPKKYVNFFRIILNHTHHTENDLDLILEKIHELGKDF